MAMLYLCFPGIEDIDIRLLETAIRRDRIVKVVLLAGGFGTRISEESQYRPKPMIEIGRMPIL